MTHAHRHILSPRAQAHHLKAQPMKISELKAARDEAGAQYAEAATAYVRAWAQLEAFDKTMRNGRVGAGGHGGFGSQPSVATHGEFLPAIDLDVGTKVREMHEAQLLELGA